MDKFTMWVRGATRSFAINLTIYVSMKSVPVDEEDLKNKGCPEMKTTSKMKIT